MVECPLFTSEGEQLRGERKKSSMHTTHNILRPIVRADSQKKKTLYAYLRSSNWYTAPEVEGLLSTSFLISVSIKFKV